jgi:hypothetical protein
VRCELTPEQADRVAVGQAAEVWAGTKKGGWTAGRVVLVGIAADKDSGAIPAVVRVPNAKAALRSGVPIQVRLTEAAAADGAK